MRSRSYHYTALGSYAPLRHRDNMGYIRRHDSPRYGTASDEQLDTWSQSRLELVRAAADTEIAERALERSLNTSPIRI